MTPFVLNKNVSLRELQTATCMYLYTPADTYMYSVFAFGLSNPAAVRPASSPWSALRWPWKRLNGPGSASMALEAPFRAPSCFWAEQWVGFVQFELKKTRPHTWPEPFLLALIPSIPLGLAGRRGGRPQARNGTIPASCGSVLVF